MKWDITIDPIDIKMGIRVTSTSGQNEITKNGFTLLLDKTENPDKRYETTVFKTLDIRQQRIMIPEIQETGDVGPAITPAHCLERVSSLQYREGDPGGAQQTQ